MARIVKEYDERMNELLDAAQQLLFEKGYESTSVNEIINKVGVAKGTFYHYFKSKVDLLDKLVERFTRGALAKVQPVLDRQNIGAIEKLNLFFLTMRDSKMDNKELMRMLMKMMYKDENLTFRHKVFKRSVELMSPLFAGILRQGVEENVLSLIDVEETSQMIFSMSLSINEIVVSLLLEADKKPGNFDIIEKKMRVWERNMERILGAGEGSIKVVNREDIKLFKFQTHGE